MNYFISDLGTYYNMIEFSVAFLMSMEALIDLAESSSFVPVSEEYHIYEFKSISFNDIVDNMDYYELDSESNSKILEELSRTKKVSIAKNSECVSISSDLFRSYNVTFKQAFSHIRHPLVEGVEIGPIPSSSESGYLE